MVRVGCLGVCDAGPVVAVVPDGTVYLRVRGRGESDLIVREHLVEGRPVEALEFAQDSADGRRLPGRAAPFFTRQRRVALRNCGLVDPSSIGDYVALDGYLALEEVLTAGGATRALEALERAHLRGDGDGEGDVAAVWRAVSEAGDPECCVVCNAHPLDGGAGIARRIIEGDPQSVIEGVLVAGLVVGARRGFVCLPGDARLAIERLDAALEQAYALGLLGENVLGSGFPFNLEAVAGPGSLVLGVGDALLRSLEGRRGVPGPRRPTPSAVGLWGRPTVIHGAETFARVPPIVARSASGGPAGPDEGRFATRVLSLRGSLARTAVVEVPLDADWDTVLNDIGGGIRSRARAKVVHIRGAVGGGTAVPPDATATDLRALEGRAGTCGSGTFAVLDEGCCLVEVATVLLASVIEESCGKCPSCRIGIRVMLGLLKRISRGEGTIAEVDALESLARHVEQTSLCLVGQGAPGTVLTALRDFRPEFLAHVAGGRCPTGRCTARPSLKEEAGGRGRSRQA